MTLTDEDRNWLRKMRYRDIPVHELPADIAATLSHAGYATAEIREKSSPVAVLRVRVWRITHAGRQFVLKTL